jgi:predicted small lipoprotein YifL
MYTRNIGFAILLSLASLAACGGAKGESPAADAAAALNDNAGSFPVESSPAAPVAVEPMLPPGPPTSEAEAKAMAIGTWEGKDTNGIFTRYEISDAGGYLSVLECSMYSDMRCGEIGGSHEVVQKRFLDTGEPYFGVKLAWGTTLVLRSSTEATVSDEDGSVPFTKK